MTMRPRRLVLLCGLLPAIVAAVLSLYRPSFLENFEYSAYDTLVRAARTRPPSGNIVIVDVDERSLSAHRPMALAPRSRRQPDRPLAGSRRLHNRPRHHLRGVGPVRRDRRHA